MKSFSLSLILFATLLLSVQIQAEETPPNIMQPPILLDYAHVLASNIEDQQLREEAYGLILLQMATLGEADRALKILDSKVTINGQPEPIIKNSDLMEATLARVFAILAREGALSRALNLSKTLKSDTARALAYTEIAKAYSQSNPHHLAVDFSEVLVRNIKPAHLRARALADIATAFAKINRRPQTRKLLEEANKMLGSFYKADLRDRTRLHIMQAYIESDMLTETLPLSKTLSVPYLQPWGQTMIAQGFYSVRENKAKALEWAEKAETLLADKAVFSGQPSWQATHYVQLAKFYATLNMSDKSRNSFALALAAAQSVEVQSWKDRELANIAIALSESEQYDDALEFLEKHIKGVAQKDRALAGIILNYAESVNYSLASQFSLLMAERIVSPHYKAQVLASYPCYRQSRTNANHL